MHSDSLCVIMKLFITGTVEVRTGPSTTWAQLKHVLPCYFGYSGVFGSNFFGALEWNGSVEISLQRAGRTSQGNRKTLLLLTETGIVCLLRPTSQGRKQLGLREAGFRITRPLPRTCRRPLLRGALACEDACAHHRQRLNEFRFPSSLFLS